MNCDEAREEMLEAAPADLASEIDSALSRHLRHCPACRAAAAHALAVERGMAEWLEAAEPATAAATAIPAARATARRRAAARPWVGAGVAVAAGLAALLIWWHPPEGLAPPTPRSAASRPGFSVTPPPGRDVIVLTTPNPRIVVVWYVPSRRSS
jgi:anti-sigma factor RsiW